MTYMLVYLVGAIVTSAIVIPWMVRLYLGDPCMSIEERRAAEQLTLGWGTEQHILFGVIWPVLVLYFLFLKVRKLGRWLLGRSS